MFSAFKKAVLKTSLSNLNEHVRVMRHILPSEIFTLRSGIFQARVARFAYSSDLEGIPLGCGPRSVTSRVLLP
jgi:hypothetical protein